MTKIEYIKNAGGLVEVFTANLRKGIDITPHNKVDIAGITNSASAHFIIGKSKLNTHKLNRKSKTVIPPNTNKDSIETILVKKKLNNSFISEYFI